MYLMSLNHTLKNDYNGLFLWYIYFTTILKKESQFLDLKGSEEGVEMSSDEACLMTDLPLAPSNTSSWMGPVLSGNACV